MEGLVPPLGKVVRRYQRLLRYLMAGGTAATVDLLLLYIFTDIFGIYYLLSAVLAFLVAFAVSFTLQKFWTFQDHSTDRVHTQAVAYFFIAGGNLLLNTVLMYVLVDGYGVWYLLAQFIISGLIAFGSFFISRYLFRQRDLDTTSSP